MNLRLKAVAAVFLCCSLILTLFGCRFASGKMEIINKKKIPTCTRVIKLKVLRQIGLCI